MNLFFTIKNKFFKKQYFKLKIIYYKESIDYNGKERNRKGKGSPDYRRL